MPSPTSQPVSRRDNGLRTSRAGISGVTRTDADVPTAGGAAIAGTGFVAKRPADRTFECAAAMGVDLRRADGTGASVTATAITGPAKDCAGSDVGVISGAAINAIVMAAATD